MDRTADRRHPGSPLDRLRRFGRHPRLMGVDVARGLAMLGMLGAHVGLGTAGFDWAVPETWSDLMNGRPAILFAVIAGVSLSLMHRDLDPRDAEAVRIARLQLVGRGITVFAIGIVLELLFTPIAIILAIYGLLFVVAAPMVTWRTRSLLIGAVGLTLLAPVVLGLLNLVAAGGNVGGGIAFALTGTYPIPVWIAFLLLGLAVGRLSLQRVRMQLAVLAIGVVLAVIGYGLAALASPGAPETSTSASSSASDSAAPTGPASDFDLEGLECQSIEGVVICEDPARAGTTAGPDLVSTVVSHWLDDSAHSGGALEIIGSGGLALAVLAAMLLLARPLRWVLIPLAAVGSMPLTVYSLHVVLFFGGVIVTVAPPMTLWIVISVALLVFSTVWALVLGRGPLERLTARAARAYSRQSVPRRSRATADAVPAARQS